MALVDIRCNACGGSGRVLKQNYNQSYANTLGNAGPGMVACPSCHGRGTVQSYKPDNSGGGVAASGGAPDDGIVWAGLLIATIGAGIGAYIADQIFESSTITWIGAGIGLALSMFFELARLAVLSVVFAIIGLALLTVLVFGTFSLLSNNGDTQKEPAITTGAKGRQMDLQQLKEDLRSDSKLMHSAPKPESECTPCALVINSPNVEEEIKEQQRVICEWKKQKCAMLGITW